LKNGFNFEDTSNIIMRLCFRAIIIQVVIETTVFYIRWWEFAWNAPDGDLGFRGHMVSPCFTATKKALQKRRQKLGVSAGDISGLKLSRRSKHVLPAWFCAPCLAD